jgi:hypothetical protein
VEKLTVQLYGSRVPIMMFFWVGEKKRSARPLRIYLEDHLIEGMMLGSKKY